MKPDQLSLDDAWLDPDQGWHERTDFGDEWDGDEPDDRCDIPHAEDEYCPFCCPNDGWYQPGTVECEWCEYRDECARWQAERFAK